MLVETDRLLLTAFVDGELSSRQHRQLLKLLRRSPEARSLLRELQENARTLKHLPRPKMLKDLSAHTIQLIVERSMKPRSRPLAASKRGFSVWLGYAAAAAVLLVVAGASYLLFANMLNPGPVPLVADHGRSTEPKTTEPTKPLDVPLQNTGIAKKPETIDIMPKKSQDDGPVVKVQPMDNPKPDQPTPE